MEESQDIEFKENWRDDYLRWICGFANAKGGRIYIGVNDRREVVGVENASRLMEDIPNKIQNSMGIVCDVNMLEKDGRKYVEIVVSPSAFSGLDMLSHGDVASGEYMIPVVITGHPSRSLRFPDMA